MLQPLPLQRFNPHPCPLPRHTTAQQSRLNKHRCQHRHAFPLVQVALFLLIFAEPRRRRENLEFPSFLELSMSQPSASPSTPTVAPAINFATEWLDEHGNVCPKAVDYASQCPKGHGLVALTDAGGGASAHRVMCRVCHSFTERDHAPQWLTCSVTGCCAGYAVCDCCVSALQQAPPAAAGGNHSPSQVGGAEDTLVNIVAG